MPKVVIELNEEGRSPTVTTLSESKPTLKEAQKIVGGYVEMLRLPDGSQMLVNEDGLSMQLEYNPLASAIAGRSIVGNVLVLQAGALWT